MYRRLNVRWVAATYGLIALLINGCAVVPLLNLFVPSQGSFKAPTPSEVPRLPSGQRVRPGVAQATLITELGPADYSTVDERGRPVDIFLLVKRESISDECVELDVTLPILGSVICRAWLHATGQTITRRAYVAWYDQNQTVEEILGARSTNELRRIQRYADCHAQHQTETTRAFELCEPLIACVRPGEGPCPEDVRLEKQRAKRQALRNRSLDFTHDGRLITQ